MKKLTFIIMIGIVIATSGCGLLPRNSEQPTASATQPVEAAQPTLAEPAQPRSIALPTLSPQSERRCGDGVCDGPENAQKCPADCGGKAESPAVTLPDATSLPVETQAGTSDALNMEPGPEVNSYRVTNPTSGAKLFVHVARPQGWNGEALPTLVLVPGGAGPGDPQRADRLAQQGFIVVAFDPDGRGRSEGSEDQDGFIQQDGLAAVVQAIATLPEVDKEKIGIVTYSYGITMGSGTLARYPDLPVKFLIDWEGPADRYYTGCQGGKAKYNWPECDNDEAWAQREAVTFIAQIKVPYLRLQSEKDHVQPNNNHAIDMINATIAGGVPWVRLNEYPPNQTYDTANPPAMFPEEMDKSLDSRIAQYAKELFEQF